MTSIPLFIAYAHEDTKHAEYIENIFDNSPYKCWRDKRIPAGENWKDFVEHRIIDSSGMILLISPEALKSPEVAYEWAFARGAKIPIIPVCWQMVDLNQAPSRFRDQQIQNVSKFDRDRWIELLSAHDFGGARTRLVRAKALKLASLRQFIPEFPSEIREGIEETMLMHLDCIGFSEDRLYLIDDNVTLQGSSLLWERLAHYALQWQALGGGHSTHLLAYATHSVPVDLWLRPEAKRSLTQQKLFVSNGGRLIRILTSEGDDEIELCAAKKTCALMAEFGIYAFYLRQAIWSTDDFLWIPSARFAHTWRRFQSGPRIELKYFYPNTLAEESYRAALQQAWHEAVNHEQQTPAQLGLDLPD